MHLLQPKGFINQLSIVTNSDDTTEDDVSGITVLLQLQPNGYNVNSELLILEQKKYQHYLSYKIASLPKEE